MDYETPDGSQFSLREVWTERDGEPVFDYTSVSAYVDGSAYVGKLLHPLDDVDEADILPCLELVPTECIHPKFQEGFTIIPDFHSAKHYLKAPSFTFDDCREDKTFVADCVLNEVSVLERLKLYPHPNIVSHLGCVVKDGRITHICLEKYPASLVSASEMGLDEAQRARVFDGIRAGIVHLHSLGLAHNDINPENICIDANGEPIIVDFDACLPFGEKLIKAIGAACNFGDGPPTSNEGNDLIYGLDSIRDFLWPPKDNLNDDESVDCG